MTPIVSAAIGENKYAWLSEEYLFLLLLLFYYFYYYYTKKSVRQQLHIAQI